MIDYWKEALACAAEDNGVELTKEQLDAMAYALEGAYETYGLATGSDIADCNWRASEDDRLVKKGAEQVFRHVESCVAELDNGPSRIFDVATHRQKLALHELFAARKFVRMTGGAQ